MHLGNALQKQRETAKLSQRELAERMNTSQGTLSRLETNPQPDGAEAIAYLSAVDSPSAKALMAYLDSTWHHIDKVAFDHPDRDVLGEAETALSILKGLRTKDESGPLNDELNLYEKALHEAVEYLSSLRHTVSFIGTIGAGKTSALCSLIGLTVEDGRPVLSYGAGRTTLCEVRVLEGPEHGIIVEPLPSQEVSQVVEDFCDFLWSRAHEDKTDDDATLDLSVEMKRCLRNMTGLQQKRNRETKTVHDQAVELARQCESKGALKQALMGRLNLADRTTREVWYEGQTGGAHDWLGKTFGNINHGKDTSFSIPKCIRVVVPHILAKAGADATPYSISIVDTKGLDDLAPRADIKEQLDDERTVSVLCNRFESAPDGNVHAVLGFACDIGIRDKITRNAILMLLEREGEAIQVNDFDGNPVESREDGREVKRGEVEDQLANDPLNINGMEICAFDHRSDDPQGTMGVVLDRIRLMRSRYASRIVQIAERLIERRDNFDRIKEEAAINAVIKDVRAWLEGAREEQLSISALLSLLPRTIGEIHTSSIRASVNRRGNWHNLDYYDQLAFGARTDVANCYKQSLDKLRGVLEVKRTRDDLRPARTFIDEVGALLDRQEQQLLEKSEIAARASYEAPLREDGPLWTRSRQRWGGGPGYRDEIRAWTAEWLRSSQHDRLADEVRQGLHRDWEALLDDIDGAVRGHSST